MLEITRKFLELLENSNNYRYLLKMIGTLVGMFAQFMKLTILRGKFPILEISTLPVTSSDLRNTIQSKFSYYSFVMNRRGFILVLYRRINFENEAHIKLYRLFIITNSKELVTLVIRLTFHLIHLYGIERKTNIRRQIFDILIMYTNARRK